MCLQKVVAQKGGKVKPGARKLILLQKQPGKATEDQPQGSGTEKNSGPGICPSELPCVSLDAVLGKMPGCLSPQRAVSI